MLPYRLRSTINDARRKLQRGLRSAVFGGKPTWHRRPNALPWFDRPDAAARVDGDDVLARWVRDGYVVVDDLACASDIDEMLGVLDGLWDASAPIDDLQVLGLRDTDDGPQRSLSHRELLALAPADRRRLRDTSDWRIHGFHYVNAAAKRLYWERGLALVASRIFGRRARPIAAINFMSGSEQELHQDMAVFHIFPQNYLIGAWIACEDIAPESGPLVIYPGSHRAPFFPGFTDYPQTNLRTADADTSRAYQAYVDDVARGFPRHEFLAKKGQVLFWHGMLIHGGAPVARRGTSRKSMVLHYSVRGADRGGEVHGPFNW